MTDPKKLSPEKQKLLKLMLKKKSQQNLDIPILERSENSNTFPLSPAQFGLWFLSKKSSFAYVYNIPLLLTIKGELDIEKFKTSISELIRRHESLRTCFIEREKGPVQLVMKDVGIPFEFVKSSFPERIIKEAGRTVFDLSKAPLFKAVLIETASNEYKLSLTFHHIIFDGWSKGVFYRELFACYKGSALIKLDVQYPDYSAWLDNRLKTIKEKQLNYWKKRFTLPPPALSLPLRGIRPLMQNHNKGARHNFNIPVNLIKKISFASRKYGATDYMLLLAALKIVFYRYSGQRDLVIGTPVANRNRSKLHNIIGCMINMVAVRSEIKKGDKFSDYLKTVRKSSIEAFSNSDVPFENVVSELHLKRDLSKHPLYQVIFQIQNYPTPIMEVDGITFESEGVDIGISQVDLTVDIEQGSREWNCLIEYNTELYHTEMIKQIAAHWVNVLTSVCDNPELLVDEIELLSKETRDRIIYEWNSTSVDYPCSLCAHQLIEKQVEINPDKIAIIYKDQKITYNDLNKRANRLAHLIKDYGIEQNSKVCVYLERGIDFIVAELAAWKAGAAYVPLDPNYPDKRISYMIQNSEATLLITQSSIVFDKKSIKHICLDNVDLSSYPEDNPKLQLSSNNLAYIIYTSGSSGKPKGVQIEHRSFVNFLTSMKNEPGIISEDVLISVTTPCFDISGLEFFLPLISGSSLVVMEQNAAMNGRELSAQIDKLGTIMQATPVTWRLLLESGWKGNKRLKMLCGGEGWSRELADALLEKGGELWNMYGPTETTVWSSIEKITPNGNGPISIGRPIANTSLYILDTHLNPVPVGVAGELWIGGDGLSKGYYNSLELTESAFFPDSFNKTPGSRMYKTGDMAKWILDGRVECLGRIDSQVKIRGYRIELEEVEQVIEQYPGIKQSVAIVTQMDDSQNCLSAYYICNEDMSIDLSKLLKFLKNNLPDYMIPSNFMELEKFPLTPNSKVDRKSLPKIGVQRYTDFVGPRTPAEGILANIWCKVLSIDKVGVFDNFFDLGGYSLLAIKLINYLSEAGYTLKVEDLFLHPTIDEMVSILNCSSTVESDDIKWSSLITLRKGDNKKVPIFFIHTAPGDVLGYADVIHDLNIDQPCYGFQSLGLVNVDRAHSSIKEMAVHYVNLMTEFYPSGPFLLAGWCFGGTVAFEMAEILKAAGHKVELVVLLDTFVFPPLDKWLRFKMTIKRCMFLMRLPLKRKISLFKQKMILKIKGRHVKSDEGELQIKVSTGHLMNREKVYRNNINMIKNHQSIYYRGNIKIFCGKELDKDRIFNPSLGWDLMADESEIIPIPGNHATMMHEPNVKEVSRHIQKFIDLVH